ncbi:DUF5675 family protein [Parapedobacter sp. 2B3]|uniref:DUF5675 family protein n=1 Tax=Parapedobacter sp. 2B3 TaxID=3342381 RepID=UPI0035B5F602
MNTTVQLTGARRSGGPGMLALCLHRTYLDGGTNGSISIGGRVICHTIELPWRDNRRNVSCIPEGRYRLELYCSRKFGDCLAVKGVPRRHGILIHPANDAATELWGCIAPVTKITGEGKGIYSRIALERLEREVMGVLEEGEEVWLEVSGCRTASAYCVR